MALVETSFTPSEDMYLVKTADPTYFQAPDYACYAADAYWLMPGGKRPPRLVKGRLQGSASTFEELLTDDLVRVEIASWDGEYLQVKGKVRPFAELQAFVEELSPILAKLPAVPEGHSGWYREVGWMIRG